MSEQDWDSFYYLLDKIVHSECETFRDKARQVVKNADSYDRVNDLTEFLAWFNGEVEPYIA